MDCVNLGRHDEFDLCEHKERDLVHADQLSDMRLPQEQRTVRVCWLYSRYEQYESSGMLCHVLSKPTAEQIKCHAPKPILLNLEELTFRIHGLLKYFHFK